MASFVLTARRSAVAVITLNRPDVLNAWHAPMRDELVAALTACDADPEIRAVVLTGAGDRAFSAGQDLNEAKDFDPDRAEAWIREWERLYDRLRTLSKPVIAALNGVAAGSAFQVALLCDFRIGHPGVRMGQPEIDAGIASTTGPWIMREMLGLARTIDLTLTGRLMDAAECLSVGLLTRVVAPDRGAAGGDDARGRARDEAAGRDAPQPPPLPRNDAGRVPRLPRGRDPHAAGILRLA